MENLNQVKAGDTVKYTTPLGETIVMTVTKVTKTQIQCGNSAFRIKDGKMVGASQYSTARISL